MLAAFHRVRQNPDPSSVCVCVGGWWLWGVGGVCMCACEAGWVVGGGL